VVRGLPRRSPPPHLTHRRQRHPPRLRPRHLPISLAAGDALRPLDADQPARLGRILGGEPELERAWRMLQHPCGIHLATGDLTRSAEGGRRRDPRFASCPLPDLDGHALGGRGPCFGPGAWETAAGLRRRWPDARKMRGGAAWFAGRAALTRTGLPDVRCARWRRWGAVVPMSVASALALVAY
jgi:hypothetical protein